MKMGYSTYFDGSFKLNKKADAETRALLERIESQFEPIEAVDGIEPPANYGCDWQLQEDGETIEHNGREKFYEWLEWARFLQALLRKRGYIMTGEVDWQGEETGDRGTMIAVDGQITTRPINDDTDQQEAFQAMHAALKMVLAEFPATMNNTHMKDAIKAAIAKAEACQ
jgi:hypothetical protein